MLYTPSRQRIALVFIWSCGHYSLHSLVCFFPPTTPEGNIWLSCEILHYFLQPVWWGSAKWVYQCFSFNIIEKGWSLATSNTGHGPPWLWRTRFHKRALFFHMNFLLNFVKCWLRIDNTEKNLWGIGFMDIPVFLDTGPVSTCTGVEMTDRVQIIAIGAVISERIHVAAILLPREFSCVNSFCIYSWIKRACC